MGISRSEGERKVSFFRILRIYARRIGLQNLIVEIKNKASSIIYRI